MKRIYILLTVIVLGVLLFPLRWASIGAPLSSESWFRQAAEQAPQDAPERLIPLNQLDSLPLAASDKDPLSRDPRHWRTRVAELTNLRQTEIFPGADLVFAGNRQKLEAVLIVKPGADLAAIHFDFPQAETVSADAQGNIWVVAPEGDLGLLRPQLLGQRKTVKDEFVAEGARVALRVVGHNKTEPLLVRFDVVFPIRAVNLLDSILFRVIKSDEQPLAVRPHHPAAPTTITSVTKTVDKATANPGETPTYTVTITNNNAGPVNGVTFTDMIDANTTLVPGSVKAAPLAVADAYNVYGNVSITIPDGALDLLSNDVDPDGGTLTATAETKSSAQCTGCNNVTINADGSFTYDPPVGYSGPDSFTYTVNDPGNNTDTGTVTLTISNMIWFVNSGASTCTTLANQCGKLSKPFSDLPSFQAVNDNNTGMRHPGTGQDILSIKAASIMRGR